MEGNSLGSSLQFWLNLAYYSTLIPPIIGVVRFSKLSVFQKRVFYLTLLILLNETITYWMRAMSINNLWVFHIFIPMLVLFTLLVYRRILVVLDNKTFWVLSGLFVLVSGINTFSFQGLGVLNSNVIVASGLLFIVLSIAYFYQTLVKNQKGASGHNVNLWFNTGILLHYSGTLMLFFFVNIFIREQSGFLMISWKVNILLTLLLYMCYTISLWVRQED